MQLISDINSSASQQHMYHPITLLLGCLLHLDPNTHHCLLVFTLLFHCSSSISFLVAMEPEGIESGKNGRSGLLQRQTQRDDVLSIEKVTENVFHYCHVLAILNNLSEKILLSADGRPPSPCPSPFSAC